MRPSFRHLATLQKGASAYLEPGAPTGLTGLLTSPAPRTTLLYLYNLTLQNLRALPEGSVYRQSTEALTRHRLSIIEAAKPAGLSEWQTRVKGLVDAYPETYQRVPSISDGPGEIVWRTQEAAARAVKPTGVPTRRRSSGMTNLDAEGNPERQGTSTPMTEEKKKEVMEKYKLSKEELQALNLRTVVYGPPEIEAEPALTAEQIGEVEAKIGAGLIEEVIEVAEGELRLVGSMVENKAWEDLEEKPVEGQWTYFARDTHTGETQAP